MLLLICKIQFAFFRLKNDLGEIETSSNFIASFYLKMFRRNFLLGNESGKTILVDVVF